MSLQPINNVHEHAELLAPGEGPLPPIEPAPRLRRIPNLGHAVLLTGFAAMLFLLLQLGLIMLSLSPVSQSGGQIAVVHPMLQLGILGVTYAGTLGAAWLFFPLVWHRPFGAGMQWNVAAARSHIAALLGLGLALGLTMQVVTYFITPPKQLPIDQFFANAIAAWVITFFGTCVAPVFEEIAFRGFLLPAFAIAWDWLRMPRTDASREQWQTTDTLSAPSLIVSAVITSALFAMIHAQQVAHLWAALAALFCVSLVLTWVRIRMKSVAASTVVHAAYNGFIFLLTIIQTGGYRHLERLAR